LRFLLAQFWHLNMQWLDRVDCAGASGSNLIVELIKLAGRRVITGVLRGVVQEEGVVDLDIFG
jgi:hypothetical protein